MHELTHLRGDQAGEIIFYFYIFTKLKKSLEKKTKKYQNIYLKKLLESIDNEENIYNLDGVDDDADKVNFKLKF